MALLALAVCVVSPGLAQERRDLVEVGAAGVYQSYGSTAGLNGSVGGLGRIGVWLPLNFSVEVEGSVADTEPVRTK